MMVEDGVEEMELQRKLKESEEKINQIAEELAIMKEMAWEVAKQRTKNAYARITENDVIVWLDDAHQKGGTSPAFSEKLRMVGLIRRSVHEVVDYLEQLSCEDMDELNSRGIGFIEQVSVKVSGKGSTRISFKR